jgi:hypothetical protein
MALIQSLRLRRGVPEVVYTIAFEGDVLAKGARLLRRGRWPARADSLRAIDQCGRTLKTWEIAADADQPSSALPAAALDRGAVEEPAMPGPLRDHLKGEVLSRGSHHFGVGQPVFSWAMAGVLSAVLTILAQSPLNPIHSAPNPRLNERQ